jgi:hypothetical protein
MENEERWGRNWASDSRSVVVRTAVLDYATWRMWRWCRPPTSGTWTILPTSEGSTGLTPDARRILGESKMRASPMVVTRSSADDSVPRFLLRDRDSIYGEAFARRVKSMDIREVLAASHAPWQNPFVERVIGSIRRGRPDTLRPSALPKPNRARRRAGGRTCSGAGRSRRSDCPFIRSTASESRSSVATAATPCAWNSPMVN